MYDSKKVTVLLTLISFALGLQLPSTFQKCKADSSLGDCLKSAIQDALPKIEKGLPEFNLPSVQPLEIASLTVGTGNGPVNVKQYYENVKIYNIPTATLETLTAILGDNAFDLIVDAMIPEVKLEAQYKFNGKVLMLPIVGSGASHGTFNNLKIHLELHAEHVTRKGKKYAEFKSFKVNLEPDHITLQFDNLFDGDERLGNEMNKLLNDNWKEIWSDVKDGYGEAIGTTVMNIANQIFTKLPVTEIFA